MRLATAMCATVQLSVSLQTSGAQTSRADSSARPASRLPGVVMTNESICTFCWAKLLFLLQHCYCDAYAHGSC
jgi:hypothetical protein